MYIKKFIALLTCTILLFNLFGCATNQSQGYGTVVTVKKISGKDYKPHHSTETGARFGGVVGAASGASLGGLVGILAGGLAGAGGSVMVISTVVGAGVGGVLGGIAGLTVGSTLGYLADTSLPDAGMYQFEVKLNNDPTLYPDAKLLTITQYSRPIAVNTKVRIVERDGTLYIIK